MNAQALIQNFGESVTVTRYAGGGSYVDGYYVESPTSVFETTMSIQPLNGRELLNNPEAQRARRMVKGYAYVELFTVETSTSRKADIVTFLGQNYEVQAVERWRSSANSIAPHWKVMLAQVNP